MVSEEKVSVPSKSEEGIPQGQNNSQGEQNGATFLERRIEKKNLKHQQDTEVHIVKATRFVYPLDSKFKGGILRWVEETTSPTDITVFNHTKLLPFYVTVSQGNKHFCDLLAQNVFMKLIPNHLLHDSQLTAFLNNSQHATFHPQCCTSLTHLLKTMNRGFCGLVTFKIRLSPGTKEEHNVVILRPIDGKVPLLGLIPNNQVEFKRHLMHLVKENATESSSTRNIKVTPRVHLLENMSAPASGVSPPTSKKSLSLSEKAGSLRQKPTARKSASSSSYSVSQTSNSSLLSKYNIDSSVKIVPELDKGTSSKKLHSKVKESHPSRKSKSQGEHTSTRKDSDLQSVSSKHKLNSAGKSESQKKPKPQEKNCAKVKESHPSRKSDPHERNHSSKSQGKHTSTRKDSDLQSDSSKHKLNSAGKSESQKKPKPPEKNCAIGIHEHCTKVKESHPSRKSDEKNHSSKSQGTRKTSTRKDSDLQSVSSKHKLNSAGKSESQKKPKPLEKTSAIDIDEHCTPKRKSHDGRSDLNRDSSPCEQSMLDIHELPTPKRMRSGQNQGDSDAASPDTNGVNVDIHNQRTPKRQPRRPL